MQNGIMDGMGYFGGMGSFGPAMMLLWIALIVALIVFLVRWLGGGSKGAGRTDAMNVLRNRFARGEIDQTEFEDRKQQLEV